MKSYTILKISKNTEINIEPIKKANNNASSQKENIEIKSSATPKNEIGENKSININLSIPPKEEPKNSINNNSTVNQTNNNNINQNKTKKSGEQQQYRANSHQFYMPQQYFYPQYMFQQKPGMPYFVYPQGQGNFQNMPKPIYMTMPMYYNMNMNLNQINNNFSSIKQPQQQASENTKK